MHLTMSLFGAGDEEYNQNTECQAVKGACVLSMGRTMCQ